MARSGRRCSAIPHSSQDAARVAVVVLVSHPPTCSSHIYRSSLLQLPAPARRLRGRPCRRCGCPASRPSFADSGGAGLKPPRRYRVLCHGRCPFRHPRTCSWIIARRHRISTGFPEMLCVWLFSPCMRICKHACVCVRRLSKRSRCSCGGGVQRVAGRNVGPVVRPSRRRGRGPEGRSPSHSAWAQRFMALRGRNVFMLVFRVAPQLPSPRHHQSILARYRRQASYPRRWREPNQKGGLERACPDIARHAGSSDSDGALPLRTSVRLC